MNKYPELEDVLEGYAVETPDGNDAAILKKWMKTHPQFAQDLLAFAAERTRVQHMPDPVLTEGEIKTAMARGRAALDAFRESPAKKKVSIHSLTDLAKEHGLNKESFAKAVGLSLSLIMYFEKRRLRAASIPDKVIERVAETLKATKEAVEEYLHREPSAGALSYKAESRPEEMPAKEFSEAVKEDRELTDEEKRSLLE